MTKLYTVPRLLLGSCLIYAVMAACSGSPPHHASTGGAGGAGGVHGMAGAGPVPDASADEMAGSRIKLKHFVGEDGTRMFYGLYDSQRGEDCAVLTASDGAIRCLSYVNNVASISTYFGDASCTQALAMQQTCVGAPPKYVRATDNACISIGVGRTHLYATGPQVTPAAVYYLDGTMCAPTTPPAGYDFYTPGPEIAPTEFVAFTVQ